MRALRLVADGSTCRPLTGCKLLKARDSVLRWAPVSSTHIAEFQILVAVTWYV
jgi:hypothetical protein